MSARDYLLAYGYTLCEDGKYRRLGKLTQVWQEIEDGKGWLRFDPDGHGNEVPEVYTIASNFAQTSGLSKVHHPGCFEWVYPDEEVKKIYRDAIEFMAKMAEEAAARKGRAPTQMLVGPPPPTPEQLASMQNAQAGQAAAVEPEKKSRWWRR